MPELRCAAVAKSYGDRPVLDGVDLVVPAGTFTAILGASGSGKTTLLRVIAGFITADRGTITVGDVVLADADHHVPAERRSIGYVTQEGALFPHLAVGENVAFGLPRSERKHGPRVAEVLELVGLDESYARRRPQELSGGEQRRVALARALAPRPRLVLLDEPFSGLDAARRAETRQAVHRALAEQETTAVLVTHDQAEALSMGREVGVLRAGRLVQCAEPATLYRTPVDLDVAQFVGEAVILPGDSDGTSVSCVLGMLPLVNRAAAGAVQAMIRPEQIRITPVASTGAPTGEPARSARVIGHTYLGPDTVLQLQMDLPAGTTVVARTFDRDPPAIGDSVLLAVRGPVVVYPVGAGPADGPAPVTPGPRPG